MCDEEYYISNVKLLKAGCQKFREEFSQEAQFDPMEQCIMIASACKLYWQRHHLRADCIAVEPASGWRGARNNKLSKALKMVEMDGTYTSRRRMRQWFTHQKGRLRDAMQGITGNTRS